MKINHKILEQNPTPFYYYDTELLERTISKLRTLTEGTPMHVHYAVKANGNLEILRRMAAAGFGADCVSGREIEAAVNAGVSPEKIFYAGVGKKDWEIERGLELGIGCFNVESIEELDILSGLAAGMNAIAPVALRVNPDIDAHTHHYITTGLEENKFGIDMALLDRAVERVMSDGNLRLRGLHFHIGSQITINDPFRLLCQRINSLVEKLRERGVELEFINVGGGLGIDYDNPDLHPIPDFDGYVSTILENLELRKGQSVHCELGRALVAQCGSLISEVTLIKRGLKKNFAIIDAGMNDLIRPALYGAHHKIEPVNPRDNAKEERYDVVGPICESSDTFGEDELLPELRRGDFIALRSAGAYGESMASTYNMRSLPRAVFKPQ